MGNELSVWERPRGIKFWQRAAGPHLKLEAHEELPVAEKGKARSIGRTKWVMVFLS